MSIRTLLAILFSALPLSAQDYKQPSPEDKAAIKAAIVKKAADGPETLKKEVDVAKSLIKRYEGYRLNPNAMPIDQQPMLGPIEFPSRSSQKTALDEQRALLVDRQTKLKLLPTDPSAILDSIRSDSKQNGKIIYGTMRQKNLVMFDFAEDGRWILQHLYTERSSNFSGAGFAGSMGDSESKRVEYYRVKPVSDAKPKAKQSMIGKLPGAYVVVSQEHRIKNARKQSDEWMWDIEIIEVTPAEVEAERLKK